MSKRVDGQVIDNIFRTSSDYRGATRQQFFAIEAMTLACLGEEDIEVTAGKFRAPHFQVTSTADNLPEGHPSCDLSCTADDNYIFLRAGASCCKHTTSQPN